MLQQLCTVDNGILYMADVDVFLLLTELINILPDTYFTRDFWVAKSYVTVCFNFFWAGSFLEQIFHKAV